jgi:hypothetical protein
MAGRAVAVIDQQPSHASAYGTHADQSDFGDLRGSGLRHRALEQFEKS